MGSSTCSSLADPGRRVREGATLGAPTVTRGPRARLREWRDSERRPGFFFRLHRALRGTPRGREQRQSTLLPGSWERKEVAQMARDWAPPVGGVAPSMPLRAGSCLASLLLACPGLQGGGGEKGNREARQLRGSRRLPAAPPPVSPELLVIDGRGCMFCSQATPSTSFALPHPHWPSSSLLGLPALRGLLYVLGVGGGGRRHIPSDLRERKTQEARSRTKTRIQKNAY